MIFLTLFPILPSEEPFQVEHLQFMFYVQSIDVKAPPQVKRNKSSFPISSLFLHLLSLLLALSTEAHMVVHL